MIKIIKSQRELLDFIYNIQVNTKDEFTVILDLYSFEIKNDNHFNKQRNIKMWKILLEEFFPNEDLTVAYNKYGKPYLLNNYRYFNISHKDQILVISISNKPIGVDIESIILKLDKKIQGLDLFLSKEEISLLKQTKSSKLFGEMWSLREALAKCKGIGLTLIPDPEIQYTGNDIRISSSYELSRCYYKHYVISIVKRSK